MLGKVMKYEFKQIRFIFLLLFALLAGFTGIAFVFGVMPLTLLNNTYDDSIFIYLVIGMSFLTYGIVFVAISVGVHIYIGMKFYNSMYSNAGYLTNTLPLTTNKLLLGKIIPSAIMLFILRFLIASSFIILLSGYLSGLMGISNFFAEIRHINPEFDALFHMNIPLAIIWVIITSVFDAFSTALILFLSASVGQIFNTHRVLMGVLSFVSIIVILSILNSIFEIVFNVTGISITVRTTNFHLLANFIMTIVRSVILMFITYASNYFIIKYKLNLE